MSVLHVKVAEPTAELLERARRVMEALDGGERPEPYFGIGFDSLPELLAVFTLDRWNLMNCLRIAGPLTLAQLAGALDRAEADLQADVAALIDWTLIERDPAGRLRVPWDEIDLRLPLAQRAA